MDSQLLDFVENSGKIESMQDEITTITRDLDTYIEKNSERTLEFMKFEAIDRLAIFVNQYKSMIEAAKRLEQNFLTDPKINALQDEVKWFQQRVDYFETIQASDSELITKYQNQYKKDQADKKALESQLKQEKNEVIKLKNQLKSQKSPTPTLKSNFHMYPADTSLVVPKSEKEKVEYLKSASKKLKKTLKTVKEEVQKYKTLQFQSRQEFLPIEHFFKDCYKSVYQLIFQRQSQLDDGQLSLAYKMFRENKMEFNEIKHKPITGTSRADSHILREAISLQNEQRLKVRNKKELSWQEFKKLPTETVFIMISNKKMLKILKSSLCNYSNKIFLTSESKSSVDQLEEFCNPYSDKLKVRTNGRGSAI